MVLRSWFRSWVRSRSRSRRLAAQPRLEVLEDRCLLATFTVNSPLDTADADTADNVCDVDLGTPAEQCTLRAAIQQANASVNTDTTGDGMGDPDIIAFNIPDDPGIPGNEVQSITLASALPAITDAVFINGYSQPGTGRNTLADGTDAVLLIEVNGNGFEGLSIAASNTRMSGLVLNRFGGFRPVLSVNGRTAVVIDGNFIGTNPGGTAASANTGTDILIRNAPANSQIRIGGPNPGDRNIIAASGGSSDGFGSGVFLSDSSGVTIEGNFIGTNAAGTAAIGNLTDGVRVNASNGISIQNNLISGNGVHGIRFEGALENLSVQGNRIGTNVTGTGGLGNGSNGIQLEEGSASGTTIIGGTTPAARNLVSGNMQLGIGLSNFSGVPIRGNFIGTDVNGTGDLGNGSHGISIFAGNNTIGGTAAAEGNVIAFNNGAGVLVGQFAGMTRNAILGNSIFANDQLGIDLLNFAGVTANDVGDGDGGGNNLQNFPETQSIELSGGMLTIRYVVSSATTNSAYPLRVEFFRADAEGQEGQSLLGFDTYSVADAQQPRTTPAFMPATAIAAGDRIVATATDANGNTSEFSAGSVAQQPNRPPTDIALSNSSIAENAGIGTLVGNLSTTDPDAGNTHAYTLVNDAGARFRISGARLEVGAALDFETATSHVVRVRTTDQGGLSFEEDFTITVANVNEVPTDVVLSNGSAPENSAAGFVVGTLTTTDPDTGDTHNYLLVNDAGGRFQIVVNQLQVLGALDFESATSHTVTVRTIDVGGLPFDEDFLVMVTNVNEPPAITSDGGGATAMLSVPENTTAVTDVDAIDPDAGTNLTFSISGGADASRFMIDSATGTLTFSTAPDFENPTDVGSDNVYDVVVQVSDGQLTDTQAITVTVILDENRAPDAVDDDATTGQNSSITINVLGNDTDADGDAISLKRVSQPSNGTVAIDPGGTSLTYSPNVGFNGADIFTYTIEDARGEIDRATVLVMVVPPAGTLVGHVFDDRNGNGFREFGEPGLGGWTVFLDANANDRLDQTETRTVTDTMGNYAFTGLAPGTHFVREVPQATWRQSFPQAGEYQVELTPTSGLTGLFFGNTRPAVQFANSRFVVAESTPNATITVVLNAASPVPVSVNYRTSNGTATTRDYRSAKGRLTFAPGQTTRTFTVPIVNDTVIEQSETANLTLSKPSHGLGANTTAQMTILDNDQPTVQFSRADSVGQENASVITFTATLSSASSETVTVDYATSGGTATLGTDYLSRRGTLTFAPGQISQNLTVPIVDDASDEAEETVKVTLTSPNKAQLGPTSTATGKITDNDPAPTVQFEKVASVISEGESFATIRAVLSAASEQLITVTAATVRGGTALARRDYTASSVVLTFQPRQTVATFNFPIIADSVVEANKTVAVALTGKPKNAMTGTQKNATVTILDDQPNRSLRIAQLKEISEAARGDDTNAFNEALRKFQDLHKSVNPKSLMDEVIRVGSEHGYDGLESFLVHITDELAQRLEPIDAALAQSVQLLLATLWYTGSPELDRNTPACIESLQRLAEPGARPQDVRAFAMLTCLSRTNPLDENRSELTDGLILPTVGAGRNILLIDTGRPLSQAISPRIISGQLPEGSLVLETIRDDRPGRNVHLLVITGHVNFLAKTSTFTIELTPGATPPDTFRVTLPVTLGASAFGRRLPQSLRRVFSIGQIISEEFVVRGGGPLTCPPDFPSTLTPCGPMKWNVTGPPPAGLTFQVVPSTGNLLLTGTVAPEARYSPVDLHLQQGNIPCTVSACPTFHLDLDVAVSLAPSDQARLSQVHQVARGDQFVLELPQALGGSGQATWAVETGSGALPDGLRLETDPQRGWLIRGTVPQSVRLGPQSVSLLLSDRQSASGELVDLNFDVTNRLSVLTQQMTIRPAGLIPGVVLTLLDVAIVGAAASCFIPNPTSPLACAALPVLRVLRTGLGIVESVWDAAIPNTDDDNADRTNLLARRIAPAQIVAVQGFFDGDYLEQLLSTVAGSYNVQLGPSAKPASISVIPPDFEFPEFGSGLALLTAGGLAVRDHQSEVFEAQSGFDQFVQKGFSLDKVHVGSPGSDEYVYVVNTHTQANDSATRAAQFQQLSSFINNNTDPRHPVLVLGDLNVSASEPEYTTMLQNLGGNFVDLCRGPANEERCGATDDTSRNAYALNWNGQPRPEVSIGITPGNLAFNLVSSLLAFFGGQLRSVRPDYTLLRQGTGYQLAVDRVLLEDAEILTGLCGTEGWTDNDPQTDPRCYLSDHFGLRADLVLRRVP